MSGGIYEGPSGRKLHGDGRPVGSPSFDYTCLIHGKKMSEHPPYGCLYCCMCFCDLTPEQCHVLPDGTKEDVCNQCAEQEKQHVETKQAGPEAGPENPTTDSQ